MSEDEEPQTFETQDEAIAQAMIDVGPGGIVEVHAEDCESEDGETGCTCEPLYLELGAEA